MRIWLAALVIVGTSGCVGVNLGQSGGSGGATGAGGATSDAGAALGANCGVDPNSGATLCLGLSLCPSITIDQSVFPNCGYRVNGGAIDVECSCGGLLCPLGASPDCPTLAQLLMQQTEGLVCQQVSEDRCVAATPSTATSTTGSGSSTCDQGCRSDCAGEPTCIQNCGC